MKVVFENGRNGGWVYHSATYTTLWLLLWNRANGNVANWDRLYVR